MKIDAYGYTALVAALLAALIFIWQGFRTLQMRYKAREMNNESEESKRLLEEILAGQVMLEKELGEIKERVQHIEKILKEVE